MCQFLDLLVCREVRAYTQTSRTKTERKKSASHPIPFHNHQPPYLASAIQQESETHTLIRSLPNSRQRNPPIQSTHPFLLDDRINRMPRVPIPRRFERVGEGVHLCLKPDFDDFHGRDDDDGFCCSGAEASYGRGYARTQE